MNEPEESGLKEGLTVFPSLHYIVFGTENSEEKGPQRFTKSIFSKDILKSYLRTNTNEYSVIMIEGGRGTFKATLARDFLLNGLIHGESVLMVSLKDNVKFNPNLEIKPRISKECSKNLEDNEIETEVFWNSFIERKSDRYSPSDTKREIRKWEYSKIIKSKDIPNVPEQSFYIEIAFKSGYILAEEFIRIFLEVLMSNKGITRIVIDDLSRIGVSYPFLFSSKTASELFITAFVHIIRNRKLSLVMTGTTGEYNKSDRMVERAKTLSDTVLTHKHLSVFGDRYITLMGDGLTHQIGNKYFNGDLVPAIIKPTENSLFTIDTETLKGLVGFETGNIYRPGLTVYMFKDTETHAKYNSELEKMLKSAFASFGDRDIKNNTDLSVNIVSYKPSESAAFHGGLGILSGNPIPQTVLCTIDEFFTKDLNNVFISVKKLVGSEKLNDETIAGISIKSLKETDNVLPYYENVLLMAYDKKDYEFNNFNSWSEVLNIIDPSEINRVHEDLVYFRSGPTETLSCLLIDAVISGSINSLNKLENDSSEILNIQNVLEEIGGKSDNICDELIALRKLMLLSSNTKYLTKNKSSKNINIYEKTEKKNSKMVDRAKLFICWYSELRDILQFKPELAARIEVCALPGKGFKGDWRIGVLAGSVNYSLGFKVLKELCSEQEDYKRFVKGIGLPTGHRFFRDQDKEFCKSSKAWPNAQEENTLGKIYQIHKEANMRKDIPKYQEINLALSTLFTELVQIQGENDLEVKELIKRNIISKIPIIVKKFSENNIKAGV